MKGLAFFFPVIDTLFQKYSIPSGYKKNTVAKRKNNNNNKNDYDTNKDINNNVYTYVCKWKKGIKVKLGKYPLTFKKFQ